MTYIKTEFCCVGVYHPNRVPGGRLEVGDGNFRPWQGVILYGAVALVSFPVICFSLWVVKL